MKVLQLLALIFGLFVVAGAQNVSDRAEKTILSGTVFDETGAVIPETKVTLTSKSGKVFSTMTNDEGVYKIELNEGKYTVEFYKINFKSFKIENYKLAFKSEMRFDISLDVAAMINTMPASMRKSKRKT